jgi:Domain of unknown function (DUF4296)
MWLRYDKIPALILVCSLTAGLLSFSCGNEEPQKEIVPQDQLTKLMIEFYLGEARLGNYSLSYDSASKLFIPFEELVLKKYGVSDSTLYNTYQYYFDHPTEMEKIYEIVIDSLSLKERKAMNAPYTAK